MPKAEAMHLENGAYVTRFDYGEYVLTADHHDPDQASNRVYLTVFAMERLIEFAQGKIHGDTLAG